MFSICDLNLIDSNISVCRVSCAFLSAHIRKPFYRILSICSNLSFMCEPNWHFAGDILYIWIFFPYIFFLMTRSPFFYLISFIFLLLQLFLFLSFLSFFFLEKEMNSSDISTVGNIFHYNWFQTFIMHHIFILKSMFNRCEIIFFWNGKE